MSHACALSSTDRRILFKDLVLHKESPIFDVAVLQKVRHSLVGDTGVLINGCRQQDEDRHSANAHSCSHAVALRARVDTPISSADVVRLRLLRAWMYNCPSRGAFCLKQDWHPLDNRVHYSSTETLSHFTSAVALRWMPRSSRSSQFHRNSAQPTTGNVSPVVKFNDFDTV